MSENAVQAARKALLERLTPETAAMLQIATPNNLASAGIQFPAAPAGGGGGGGGGGRVLFPGWPNPSTPTGRKIAQAESQGGERYDVLIERRHCGRLIGPGGSQFKELVAATGCNIIIEDKEAPPGQGHNVRCVILVGMPHQIRAAEAEVNRICEQVNRGSW